MGNCLKKFIIIILLIILCSITLYDCNSSFSPFKKTGSISVSIPTASEKTIEPNVNQIKITSFRVTGIGPEGETFNPITSSTSPIIIDNLSAGSWSITVEGLNAETPQKIIASATNTVIITSGKIASTTFSLTLVDGFGDLHVIISWPENVESISVIKGQITPSLNGLYYFDLSASNAKLVDGYYIVEKELLGLPTGSYSIRVTFEALGIQVGTPLVEAVNIYNNMSSIGELAMSEDFFPVASPIFSLADGTYQIEQNVAISCNTPNAQIYYTTDGSLPNKSSNKYVMPILISRNITLKAIAFSDGMTSSRIVAANYKIISFLLGIQTLSDSAVDVSKFNLAYKYTMLSAQTNSASQGNDLAEAAKYSYTLITTGLEEKQVSRGYKYNNFDDRSKKSIYAANKLKADIMMRDIEEKLLKNQQQQLNKKKSKDIYKSIQGDIIVGTVWNNVNIIASGTTINTTCSYISEHFYFFIDNRDIVGIQSLLPIYGKDFDSIYEIDHEKFGIENDVDDNGKIIVVLSEEISGSLLGYFYAGDKYSKDDCYDSNEGDIVYISTNTRWDINCGVLAHEFQHMIYFDQHSNRNVTSTYTWLNEALSQAAEYYNSFLDNHYSWMSNFLSGNWKDLSLTYWSSANYGYGAIFIRLHYRSIW